MLLSGKRLLIVSNRLPIVVSQKEGNWQLHHGTGGLVTALEPLMKVNHGLWVGWPGCGEKVPVVPLFKNYNSNLDYELLPVRLTDDEVEQYYRGFANETIWPLFHDLLGHCKFDGDHWDSYIAANRKFAEKVSQVVQPNSFVWIHDYQLLLVGHFLREHLGRRQLNFFLHIPFPAPDLFRRLPWKNEIIGAMLDYDHLGFQTLRDRRNFLQCVKSLVADAVIRVHKRLSTIRRDGRNVEIGHYPISIDFDEFNDMAHSREVADAAWYLHEQHGERTLVLGLDRLDYTKGMPERFRAFERMLEKYPEVHEKISLLQIVVPSRMDVPGYKDLKDELDQLAGRINGRFSKHGWTPIHYMFRYLDRVQLLGHYRACEIALITPLRDGMNLVAKEYCASSIDNNGVLILSEFAGAAAQMDKAALMVNPYDLEGTADAIYSAFIMDADQRQRRMRVLRAEVRRNDVGKWVDWFLGSDMSSIDDESVRQEDSYSA
ncbi:MAG: trehalose-6-phosphate synthase [candidate division Zixibacteria bacterium]|nr:trehalose-6-phosphate synthase [candidate division Zixibacteria bacterium]